MKEFTKEEVKQYFLEKFNNSMHDEWAELCTHFVNPLDAAANGFRLESNRNHMIVAPVWGNTCVDFPPHKMTASSEPPPKLRTNSTTGGDERWHVLGS